MNRRIVSYKTSGIMTVMDIGGRASMEDCATVMVSSMSQAPTYTVCAVFDGHNGGDVAVHCKDMLPVEIMRRVRPHLRPSKKTAAAALSKSQMHMIPKSFAEAFHAVDHAVQARADLPNDQGSTACVAMLGAGELWVANAGDSRAILRTHTGVIDMSRDHKPMRADEHRRITEAGGTITFDDCPRIMHTLNLSRSIGDAYMRPYVIPTPEMAHVYLAPGDRYILLATDGLWDVLSSEQVAQHMDLHLDDVQQGLLSLLKGARDRGSTDNLTAMYVPITPASW